MAQNKKGIRFGFTRVGNVILYFQFIFLSPSNMFAGFPISFKLNLAFNRGDMKSYISFKNRKFVVAATVLVFICNVCLHLLQASKISQRNVSSIRNRSLQTPPISDSSTITTLSYQTYSPESTVGSHAKFYRWETGTVECTHKDVANFSSDTGSLLPSKYSRIAWPPSSSYAMCGEADLLTPRSLEEVRKCGFL